MRLEYKSDKLQLKLHWERRLHNLEGNQATPIISAAAPSVSRVAQMASAPLIRGRRVRKLVLLISIPSALAGALYQMGVYAKAFEVLAQLTNQVKNSSSPVLTGGIVILSVAVVALWPKGKR